MVSLELREMVWRSWILFRGLIVKNKDLTPDPTRSHCTHSLMRARGVVIATAAGAGLPVFEYAPRRVKQAVVGYGAASKEQVSTMVARLLNLPEIPQEDIGDAYAMAICHLHNRTGYAATENKPL